ncbi:metallophosphoesterase [Saccharothrix sp. HUAS TT1]|uniref:metallophosphoesterase n=1 Tax=unclassified Saccharothrix TaxID=2593673 RepID=UPI00345C153C
MTRIVIISDTQIPYHDRRALKSIIGFIGSYQPDEVVQIGDLMDFPQPSRWSKDTAMEFQGSVFADCEYAKKNVLAELRKVYGGPIKVVEGNHDLRPRTYLAKYAPALAESNAFNLDKLLDFEGFGIELLPEFYDFAPQWTMTHGHVGGIALSRIAGNTALNAAKRFGKSVIMGHTHRLGQGAHTTGYGGDIEKTVYGVEVGNLMDQKSAQYLKGATGNWQKGFAIAHANNTEVRVELIPIRGRQFTYNGEVFVG